MLDLLLDGVIRLILGNVSNTWAAHKAALRGHSFLARVFFFDLKDEERPKHRDQFLCGVY